MTFYQELQLSSTGSKQLIKNTADKKEKRRHILIYNFKVYLVMAFHDRDDVLGEAALTEQESGVLLYYIFKDADALDRFRLGPNGLDIRYLRTAEGKSFYRYAEQFERGDANA